MSKLKCAAVHKRGGTVDTTLEIMRGTVTLCGQWVWRALDGNEPEAWVHKCPACRVLQPCDLHLCKTSDTKSMLWHSPFYFQTDIFTSLVQTMASDIIFILCWQMK